MKMVFITTVAFALPLLVSGCADPCDKALKKAESCYKLQKGRQGKSEAPKFLQVCKLHRSKFKSCIDIKDCTKFQKCISKAGTDPKAIKELEKINGETKGLEKPAEAPKPADAMKPAEAPKPADAMKPAEAPKPADAMKPAEEPKPADAMKPAEAPKPADAPMK